VTKVIDCFLYFDPINYPILELRLNLLKDCVDYFIISEANRTHSGKEIQYRLLDRLKEIGFTENNKIIYEQVDLSNVEIQDIDRLNCAGIENPQEFSMLARSRERIQRDSLLNHLDKFEENDCFIVSDADEIIDPQNIGWIKNILDNNSMDSSLVKVPLVHLEGRADLRVYVDRKPMAWDKSMFLCKKKHLQKATPTQIRSNILIPFNISYLSENNVKIEDLGWHFSWMGSSEDRVLKNQSFIHNNEQIISRVKNLDEHNESLTKEPEENRLPPSAIKNSILKKYDTNKLPKIILENENIRKFLLPNHQKKLYSNYY